MMILIGLLVLLIHFYVCKISTDFIYYLESFFSKNVKNSFFSTIFYIIVVGAVGGIGMFSFIFPLAINVKFNFFVFDNINLFLQVYSMLVFLFTNWTSHNKYSRKKNKEFW